ncbi:serologically defined colon cancer antigen 8 homolog isoform X2 [Acanthaster planci]|uniref:Serologically defined colon cancer antigen 8 homolog isoform X2 n=1 Tax=Acanthaster planci TaxID=133434 RepID=A0A8B7ZFM0_ACAPL|nr:serologically defined colon cancer antigen 8 homolog isoform X2 [Acanthaster planci]
MRDVMARMEPLDLSDLGEGTFSSYQETVRGRANESLQELKHTFTTPFPGPQSLKPPLSTSPRHQSTTPRSSRESLRLTRRDHQGAVDRLKSLLQQHQQNQMPRQHSRHDDAFQQNASTRTPGIRPKLDMSRSTHAGPAASAGIGATSPMMSENEPRLEDVLPFMISQSAYIQQLEGENAFCKDELASLRVKIQSVVDDNIQLHEELKTSVVKLALDEGKADQGHEEAKKDAAVLTADPLNITPETQANRNTFSRMAQELEQMKALHEAKTNRLEAQLSYTRSELEKYERQCDELRSKLRMAESINLMSREETQLENGLCVKCAQHEAVIASTHGSAHVKAMERITSERDELMETLTRLRASTNDLRQRELNAYNQVKQSVTMVEQAQLEKTELLVQREQLRDDQARLQQRMEETILEHQRKLLQERELTRKECQHEMEQLSQKITKLTEDLGSSQNQLDRVTREKVAVQSEMEQYKSQIMQHSSEISQVSHGVQLSTATAKVQRDEALRQLERLRHSTEHELRDKEHENVRLNNVLMETRRRLETAEKEATVSREECIKLTESLNSAEREVSQAKMARGNLEKTRQDEVKTVTRRAQQREMDLQQIIHELESKHTLTVAELEDMIASQSTLISKLRDEGRTLTEQLDQLSNKYRTEIRRLKQTNAEMSARLERLTNQHAEMETQCVDHGRMHKKMTNKLQQMEDHAQRSAQQIYELLEKQTNLMQERQMLSQEVDFLRSQQKSSSLLSSRHAPSDLDLTPELDVNLPGRGGNG